MSPLRWSLLLLLLAATASAGFLPLIHDRPKRDNPFDPAASPKALPVAAFPTPTSTPSAVPGCGGPDTANFATFELNTETWASETFAGYTVMAVSAGAPSCFGAKSLIGAATLAHAGGTLHLAFKKNLAPALNWTSRSLVARVAFPSGFNASTASLYVKVGASYTTRSGPVVSSLGDGSWQVLSFDLGSLALSESSDVKEVGVDLFSGAADGDGASSFLIDSISVLGGPTPTITPTFSSSPTIAIGSPTSTITPSPTRTPTPSPMPTCGAAVDSANYATFEGGTETWGPETYSGYTYMTVTASTPFCMGTQALCGTANLVHGGTLHLAFKKNPTPLDWTGKSLEARIYAPSGYGASSAAIYVKCTSGWTGHQGPLTTMPAGGGWVTLDYDLTGLSLAEQADVREVGVDLFSGAADPNGSVTYCIDSVSVR